MHFCKYHALGNDYIVLEPKASQLPLAAWQIERICHRNFGVGSDGILLEEKSSQPGFTLRIFNPDGSEAEKSGNGLRIFARYLFDHQRVSSEKFTVHTKGGDVRCQVLRGGAEVEVDMGRVSFQSNDIPVTGPKREVINENLAVDGSIVTFSAATVGNPHCVVVCEHATEADARRFGPHIERHSNFPNRTNVQFLQVIDRKNIKIEIWERGAGYTLASGSSSSASAAVAHRLGLVDAEVSVHMPGGVIHIAIGSDYSICMRGAVTRGFEGAIDDEMLAWKAVS